MFRLAIARNVPQRLITNGAIRNSLAKYSTIPPPNTNQRIPPVEPVVVKPVDKKIEPVVEELKVVRPRNKSFRWGLAFGIVSGIIWGAFDNRLVKLEDSATVQPPTSCEPFPKTIELENTKFTCLGVGVRTVSFLKFHVYALGIYLAVDDLAKAKITLTAAGASENTLFDDEQSQEVIDALLSSGARLAIRIMPVRNTEFSHLRDGFVRSVMNHPMFKELNDDSLGRGISDLKQAFSRKRKVPKGALIYMVRTATGTLDALYAPVDGDFEKLGEVDDINVSRLFFLQYLSGKSPNSPTARESAAKGLLELAI